MVNLSFDQRAVASRLIPYYCSYRLISTFGHGTIRTFAANSSEMKKLAARDFEDLLQVRLCLLSWVFKVFRFFVQSFIVCNTFIWGSSWWASQQAPHETSISNSRMACSHQASNALWQHFAFARRIDYRVWPINATVPWPYLCPIQNSRASTRDCSMKSKMCQTTICCIVCSSSCLININTPQHWNG